HLFITVAIGPPGGRSQLRRRDQLASTSHPLLVNSVLFIGAPAVSFGVLQISLCFHERTAHQSRHHPVFSTSTTLGLAFLIC
ncbi:hypothetical protein B0H66DRAFT_582506, partial [Apodospora peruviana]